MGRMCVPVCLFLFGTRVSATAGGRLRSMRIAASIADQLMKMMYINFHSGRWHMPRAGLTILLLQHSGRGAPRRISVMLDRPQTTGPLLSRAA